MKTLLLTSIYTKLWGTDLGGRTSRDHHYKWSLLNILNTKPTKVVCFTSEEELPELEAWFYHVQKVDKELLEFRVYDLYNCEHYDLIQRNKDVEFVKSHDRCHEIQYMKFFWSKLIEDRHDYDRMYWIDAGLSHGGLFPEEYMMGDQWERHFLISLFTPELLSKWNDASKDKVVMFSKNNDGRYFWSQTLPQSYYNEFDRSRHIIGGMFGGTPQAYDNLTTRFEELLLTLLDKENELYHEELILSCMAVNTPEEYNLLKFDDWYARDEWANENIDNILFYHLFI
jgi:hypothetical protein